MGEHETAGPAPGSLPLPASDVRELTFTAADLGDLRRSLSEWARSQRLDVERSEELVLAVNELTTNSVRHGGGGGRLRMWRDGETLLCEVQDSGHIEQPLLAHSLPAQDARSGRGLWLVDQLCDLVEIRSAPGETIVRVHTRLS
jgi:anti-sigma regulatory factor (Ser/Thr protein kinase)